MDLSRLTNVLGPHVLPSGHLVASDEGKGPVLHWCSDAACPDGLWQRLRAVHAATGLWPLLLNGQNGPDDPHPWGDGGFEIFDPEDYTSPAVHQVSDLLARWWLECTSTTDTPFSDDDELLYHVRPYGSRWPGLAAAGQRRFGRSRSDPDEVADAVVEHLYGRGLRLGLVEVRRGADVPAFTCWPGAGNHIGDPGELSAVLRSWEDRFGARLIMMGSDTLLVSVAAPPTKPRYALGLVVLGVNPSGVGSGVPGW